MKKSYEWLKENGICTHCRKNKTVPGKVLCEKCRKESRNYRSRRSPEERNEKARIRYLDRKKAGICTRCGKKKAQYGVLCVTCYNKRMAKSNQNELPTVDLLSLNGQVLARLP
nr:MAG TPA: zinc-ribbon family protein [Caudoviricetes sp.]